jgi:hypothetical protein
MITTIARVIRQHAVNSLLMLATLVICLLALEASVRMSNGIPVLATTNFVAEALDLIRRYTGLLAYDETLGWRHADNYAGGRLFATGAHGLRMNTAEIRSPREGGVLAVGDSFTAGSGVANDETWPAQLERVSGQPIYNAAAGGWGVDQMILRAELLAPVLRPRTVIVGILADDTLRNNFQIYGGAYKPFFTIENGKAVLQGVPVPRVTGANLELDAWRRTLGHSYLVYSLARRLDREAWWVANNYGYRQVHANEVGVTISCLLMDRLVALEATHGVRVIVLMQYDATASLNKEPPWYGRLVLACAQERGLETVDTFLTLHTLSVEDPQKFKDLWLDEGDRLGHMSPNGNKLIAELLCKRKCGTGSSGDSSSPPSAGPSATDVQMSLGR